MFRTLEKTKERKVMNERLVEWLLYGCLCRCDNIMQRFSDRCLMNWVGYKKKKKGVSVVKCHLIYIFLKITFPKMPSRHAMHSLHL